MTDAELNERFKDSNLRFHYDELLDVWRIEVDDKGKRRVLIVTVKNSSPVVREDEGKIKSDVKVT
jgi:hypothetical protein